MRPLVFKANTLSSQSQFCTIAWYIHAYNYNGLSYKNLQERKNKKVFSTFWKTYPKYLALYVIIMQLKNVSP